ncbi:MAG: DNRLRE domain-containing protein, partial [Oscillospiraceae bacterium]|nr:DNRLRE domain-containing protein [Oscillospiraceae bacterium]
MVLTIVMVLNLLPAQALGEMVFTEKQTISATDETLSADATVTAPAEEEPAYIVGEIEQRRTEYTKEYRLSNGLHMAVVYGDPVHYENNGKWDEIDNTLKATTKGTYTNTAGVWDVSLPQQLNGSAPVTITKDGYTLSFVLAGELNKSGDAVVMSQQAELSAQSAAAETFALASVQAVTAEIQSTGVEDAKAAAKYPETVSDKLVSRLAYQNVFSNTGITYDLDSNKVKESIIMDSYNANLRGYKYTLNVGSLVPVLYDDGHIDFFNSDKTDVVMVMPAPFLVDAAFAYNEDIQVQLVGKGSSYTLTYILPQSWLADESRQWPVILDPVVSASNTNSNVQDQEIAENTTISHTRGVMEAGYGANGGIERFFIKYNALPSFGAADVIVNAEITLLKPNNYPTSAVIEAHQVTEDWASDTITWAEHPDWNESIEDYLVVEDAGSYTWDITNIVRGWYETGNYGVMFKASNAVEAAREVKWMQFYSSDCGFSSGRPALEITYESHNGLESYWDYVSASAGRAGVGSVNTYTGNLVWSHSDIGFGGNRAPVSIGHYYNANDIGGNTDRFGTGIGWKTSMNQRVYPCEDDDTYYLWEDGDGTVHYLEKLQNGDIIDINDPGISFAVRNHSNTHYFRISIENGPYYYFDNMRRLTRIEDVQRESNCIDVTYIAYNSYKINTVTDGAGRVYTYNYNSDGLLSHISYTGTGTTEIARVSFGYTNGLLTSITNVDGVTVTYTYENNLLTAAQDPSGLKLQYTYNSTNTVAAIREYDGSTLGGHMTLEYGHNQTVLNDKVNELTQINQYNDYGNLISVQDGLGRAQHARYTKMTKDDTGAGSQLRLSSKLQNTVNNLFTDHSFENGSNWGSEDNLTTSQHYLGATALTVTNGTLSKTEAVTSGKTYTFSAWVKTNGGSAHLTLGSAQSLELKAGSDWTRLEVSYTVTSDQLTASLVTTGTAYLDCVQLEQMAAASRYNLLENGDFTGGLGSSWTGSGYTVVDGDPAAPHMSGKTLSVTGDPEAEKHLTQTVNISGNKGDTFVLAGWAKGDSAPLNNENRSFGIEVSFNYTETVSEPADQEISFNPDNRAGTWQYAAAPIVAEEAYSSVTVTVTYDYNVNDIRFDGI